MMSFGNDGNVACPSSKPGRFVFLFLSCPSRLLDTHQAQAPLQAPESGWEQNKQPTLSLLSCPGPEAHCLQEVVFTRLLSWFWRSSFPISLWCLQRTFGQFLSSVNNSWLLTLFIMNTVWTVECLLCSHHRTTSTASCDVSSKLQRHFLVRNLVSEAILPFPSCPVRRGVLTCRLEFCICVNWWRWIMVFLSCTLAFKNLGSRLH